MTRMIERWFPCKEVTDNSKTGWGSGNQERGLFPWFAARPTAQAKAAIICSLLPWPDDVGEQERLQALVREAMTGRYAAWDQIRSEIENANGPDASVLDPFSGRAIIPLEAARLGFQANAVDYSPVAVLASHLLADFPFRSWDSEPPLPFGEPKEALLDIEPRLVSDVRATLGEIDRRFKKSVRAFYPEVGGKTPWGYLWAVSIPCQECRRRFPVVGALELRKPINRRATKSRPAYSDPGQSFEIVPGTDGSFQVIVHDGPPRGTPTLTNAISENGRKIPGKSAMCPFCSHVHPKAVHQRIVAEGGGIDELLVVAEPDELVGKSFRNPLPEDLAAVQHAADALKEEQAFTPLLPAVPDEVIAIGNTDTIRPSAYGASTFGDLMCSRQTLSFVRLSRVINELADDLRNAGLSSDYVRALTGYAGAQVARKIKFSTRGAQIDPQARDGNNRIYVNHVFANESTIGYSYDFFEVGIGEGAGTWSSLLSTANSTLRGLLADVPQARPTSIDRGSATDLPFSDGFFTAVVTDPPYDDMIAYADASDLYFVWLKRALVSTWPELAITAESTGTQEKTQEAIVKRFSAKKSTELRDHRTTQHYDNQILLSFREMRRVVRPDGLVTIVFGHGEPEVWQRLLSSIKQADLVMTASWPANTEAGGQQGAANIRTTLTMACRPVPADRPIGRKGTVEAAIKSEVKARYPEWERWGLAPTDMLMAAAGPAMEIVGQYSEVVDAKGEPVDISTFLPLARAAVQEAMAVEIDHHPLETFDSRTRFALWWVRLFGREVAPKSELRWQALAASLELAEVRDLVPDSDKGCQFVDAKRYKASISVGSSVIDIALALAAVSDQGRDAMVDVLARSGRDPQDAYLWAAVRFLADRLPDSDADSIAFNRVLRARDGISSTVQRFEVESEAIERDRLEREKQEKLF